MKYTKTPLKGAYLIDFEPIADNRGFFTRAVCVRELEDAGLPFKMVQSNISHSEKKHTLRGLHLQGGAAGEIKLFRCIQGSIIDVIIDLRKDSPTFEQYFKIELSAENGKMLYIPKGFAHGFLTLEDDTRVMYMVSEFYSKQDVEVVRWDDPYFNIDWPVTNPILSEIDANYPDYKTN